MKNDTKIRKLEQKLNKTKNVKIEEIDVSKVKNVKRLKIDTNQSNIKRILDFIICSDNPYIIKVNDIIVKMEFSDTILKADECVNKLFLNLYK